MLHLLNLAGELNDWNERWAELAGRKEENPKSEKMYDRFADSWSAALARLLAEQDPLPEEATGEEPYPSRLEVYSLLIDVPRRGCGPAAATEFRRIAPRGNADIPWWRRTLSAEDWPLPASAVYAGPGQYSSRVSGRRLSERIDFDPPIPNAEFILSYSYAYDSDAPLEPYGYWRQTIGSYGARVTMTATFGAAPKGVYWTTSLLRDESPLAPDTMVLLSGTAATGRAVSFSGETTASSCTVGLLWVWERSALGEPAY